MRVFMPFLLGLALVENMLLVGSGAVWDAAMAGQIIIYGAGALALSGRFFSSRPLVGEVGYFVRGYAMAGLGALTYLTKRDRSPWRRITGRMQQKFSGWRGCPREEMARHIVALKALPFLMVLYAPISLAIKVESPGPVFDRQLRVGLSGANLRHQAGDHRPRANQASL